MSEEAVLSPKLKQYLFGWFVAVCIASIFCAFIFAAPHGAHIGFGLRLLGAILAIVPGFIGAMLGDMLRRFVIPDFVLTSGGFFQLLKTKLFWMIGPQLIGMFIGIAFVLGKVF